VRHLVAQLVVVPDLLRERADAIVHGGGVDPTAIVEPGWSAPDVEPGLVGT
jgi:hypothetical protein